MQAGVEGEVVVRRLDSRVSSTISVIDIKSLPRTSSIAVQQ